MDDSPRPSDLALRFRLLGIPITIGLALPAFLALLGIASRRSGVLVVEWVVLGMLAILLHELGHALAFRRFGVESVIRFWLLGGLTIPAEEPARRLTGRQWLVVAGAGPLVGLVLGGLALVLAGSAVHSPDRLVRVVAADWIFVNLGWGLFNLLPITGLDGSSIAQDLAVMLIGPRGTAVVLAGSLVVSAAIAAAALEAGFFRVAILAVAFGLLNPLTYTGLREAFRPAPPAPAHPTAAAGLPAPRE